LSRDRATKNPRTAIHRRLAAERNNVVAHSARRRSGASCAVDLGSDVALAAELERSTTTHPPGDQKSRHVALAGADFRKRARDRSGIAAGMRFADEPDLYERPVRHDV